MSKTLLITGATDGIGLATAKMLVAQGHKVLVHGRNPAKLESVAEQLNGLGGQPVETYRADLSRLSEAVALAEAVKARHDHLDVLINNAGVFNASEPVTEEDLELRFVVNTLAPYLLARHLKSVMDGSGRVVNLSSAAQSSVDLDALNGKKALSDGAAYAQSKLALTMWSRQLGLNLGPKDPIIVAVNPASLLGSKMVNEAFGVAGGDLNIGADILVRAALSEEFANASGQYFDNDAGRFGPPHADALDSAKSAAVVSAIEALLAGR
ncbi:SDR family NAD(P)-dependent oxidoreductase [Ferrimonas balearica]|uniref:SDR family NAD(P)-dependent oxidoreductase n=1 Tax=Ferrimonas balearica TaxID=44012 RepID=UPI001C99B995|nr:SDR family NAD(P)-dependent oxidoreductase [Ferrimonas balearica]MBY5991803.1 SDR family NAD(P)-dependent oxidoreductase [Ferrimonas balearica]